MEWIFFATQLRTMIAAGMPVNRALEILATDAPRERVRRLCLGLSEDLRKGIPFGAAITRTAPAMPVVLRALLLSGNASGNIVPALDKFAAMQEQMRALQSVMIRAAAYPIFLCLMGILMGVAVPVAIASVSGKDPWEAFWQACLTIVLPVIVAAVAAWVTGVVLRAERFRRPVGEFLLLIPGVGRLSRTISGAVFLEILAGAVEAGQPVSAAWNLAANSVPNAAVGARIAPAEALLRGGETIRAALESTRQFSKDALAMTAVGEMAGYAPSLMRNVSARQREEALLAARFSITGLGVVSLVVIAMGFFLWPPFLSILLFFLIALMAALRP